MRHVALMLAVLVCAIGMADTPAWLASTIYDDLGKADRVPAPWTSVQVQGQTLSTWGRAYRWTAASLLPTSIKTQGQELLRGPMRLLVTLEGNTQLVPLRSLRITERTRCRVSLAASGAVSDITFRLDGWIEYDGFVWLNLTATAPPRHVVEAVRIEAPLRHDLMTLYQAFARPLAGAITDQPIQFPWFSNKAENVIDFYHWFGNEDLGLGFTYTSLEHWRPTSEDNIATFTPGSQADTYAMNLVEQPVPINGRVFRFGLQATPIKPLPPDYHSMLAGTYYREPWRAIQQLKPDVDMTLVWPLDTGIMKGLDDPFGLDAPRMADVVKGAREDGLPILTMAACPQKISPQVPELARYRDEWRTEPESVLDWDKQPQLQDCGRSETLRKWLLYGWAIENVRKFGTDGIYFDGWQAGTMACSNARHGCGWVDDQGVRHSTVPVLEGREFNQRMLLFLQDEASRRTGASHPLHYWIHSWEFVPSVMGFATEWLTGEFAGWPLHGPAMLTPEGTYGKCLGLDLFRARCLSTNWGVPNLFDALMWEAEQDCPKDKQTLMAYAWFLPHGVSPAMVQYMNQKRVVEISKILMGFDTRRARFTPGWRTNPWWKIESPAKREVMVATWDHAPAPGVLTVISNLQTEQEETVRLRWLGKKDPAVTDARTGQRIAWKDGGVTVKPGPEGFVLLATGE